MWIDLCSKSFQFKFLQSYFVFVNFTDQTIDLTHHPAEASDQNPHLILCIAGNRNLSASMIYLIHVFRKHFDLAGKQSGKSHTQNKNDQYTAGDQRNLSKQHLIN